MSRTIWKFTLEPGVTAIRGYTPIVRHVGVDPAALDNLPTVWVELDPVGDDIVEVTFIGTGHPVPDNIGFVGSVVTPAGLVWHVYETERRHV